MLKREKQIPLSD